MTTIDTCIEQIAALTEIVGKLKDDCFELQQTNDQLLRQHASLNSRLSVIQHTIEQKKSNIAEQKIKPSSYREAKTLDGNTPIRKLSNELAAELRI